MGTVSAEPQKPLSPFLFVLRLGLFVGALDISAAITSVYLSSDSSPLSVFRYIASGVFGRPAFSGGLPMALWGCLFHFLIATGWTFLYFVLYPRVQLLSKNKILSGMAFGLVIWLVMNLVVLPLSGTPKSQFNILRALEGTIILMVMIGIPVSISVYKYYSRRGSS